MSAIYCPQCLSRLKMPKMPTNDRQVQCPQCQHEFIVTPIGITREVEAVRKTPAPNSMTSSIALRSSHLKITSIVVGLVAVGAALAYSFMPGSPKEPEPKIVQLPPPIAKPEPVAPVAPVSPDPVEVQKQKDLAEAAERDKEQKRKEYIKQMIRAGRDLEEKRFELAVAGFTEALKLSPNDVDARQGLDDAQKQLAAQLKDRELDEKARVEINKLLGQGQASLEAKQYAAACEFFKLVLQKAPGDTDAAVGLKTAIDLLGKDQDEQKKQADFDKYLNAGKAALKARLFDAALREFLSAQAVLPGNPQAVAFTKQAELEIAEQKNRVEKKADVAKLVDQADVAMKTARYDDAEKLFRQALKLIPDDTAAQQGLNLAVKLNLQSAAEFQTFMNRGIAAMRDNRLQDAVVAFREAVRVNPNSDTAKKGLFDAETTLQRFGTYTQSMSQAASLMSIGRYADAVAAYTTALQNVPNDPLALRGLQEAQMRLNDEIRVKQDIDRKVTLAQLSINQQKYGEASQLLADVIRLYPNHPQIFSLQKQQRFADAMFKGTQALNSQNANEAFRQFQIAVLEYPQNANAQAGLQRARLLSKMK